MGALLSRHALRDRLDIYFNASERQRIAEQAHAAGLSLSAFVRRAALAQRIAVAPRANVEQWRALARLAGNLNVVAKALNSGATNGVDPKLIEDLGEQVRLLRLQLVEAGA